MTSPALTKSPDNQKSEKKSPSHSVGSPAQIHADTQDAIASNVPSPQHPSDPFSWLRIFKLADLMMKQGC